MKKLLQTMTVAAVFGAAFCGHGETVTFSSHASDPDNIITNDVHYSKPIAEIAKTDEVRYWGEYNSITINVPSDVTFGSVFKPNFYIGKGHYVAMNIDGTWYMPDDTSDYAEYNMSVSSMLSLRLDAGKRSYGPFRFKDSFLKFSKDADGNETELEMNGTFNFLNPNGTALNDNYLYMNQSATGKRTTIRIAGGSVTAPNVMDYGETLTNRYEFTGGSHYFRKFIMRNHNSGADDYDRTRIHVTGADTALKVNNFETQTSATTHGYSVTVDNGGSFEFAGSISQFAGHAFPFVFNGANLVVTNQAASDSYWYNPRIFATNAVFTMATRPNASGENNRLWFTGPGTMYLKDSTFNAYCTVFNTDMTMEGGTYTAKYGTKVGASNGAYTTTFRNVPVDFGTGMDLSIAHGDNDTSTLVIDGTTVASAYNVNCGVGGTSYGTLEVRSGTMTVENRLILGSSGGGKLKVSGGTLTTKNVYSAWNSASNGKTGTIEMTDGTLDVSAGIAFSIAGDAKNCKGEMKLYGGTLKTPYVKCGSNGTGSFVADGGTFVPATADTDLIQNMGVVELGEKGLTVAADKDVTLSASFANLDDADGELILTGSGVKTLSGTATTVSKIVVAGGTVVFADGAQAASTLVVTNGATVKFAGDPAEVGLKGLVCGDAVTTGVLALKRGQTLAVDGDAAFANVRVALLDDYPLDTVSTMVTATGTAADKSKQAWRDALFDSGRIAGRSYEFQVAEGDGATSFNLSVAVAARTIEVTSGSSNVGDDVIVGACARLAVSVAEDADLTFSGAVGKGFLHKTGAGSLYLTSPDNVFLSGILSAGGLLSVPCAAALGYAEGASDGVTIQGGVLSFTSAKEDRYDGPVTFAGATKACTVIKNNGDLTLGGLRVQSGDFLKRGVGKLTIAPPSGTTWQLTADNGSTENGWDPTDTSALVFSDDAAVPDHGYLGFNVAEGEVVLKGDATTVFSSEHNVLVGPNVASCDAIQTLTVDGATAYLARYNNFFLGAYTSATAPAKAKAAAFNVVNGADVTVNTLIIGRSLGTPNCTTCLVDNATLRTGSFRPAYYWDGKPEVIVRNGGRILASDLYQTGVSSITVTGGTLAKNASGDGFPATIYGEHGGTWRFRGNAMFACHTLTFTKGFNQYNRLTLDFNGGTWKSCDGDKQTFRIFESSNLIIKTTGEDGLTLPVAVEKTVNVARAITGEGAVIKTGAGTLRFETQGTWDSTLATKTPLADPVSLAFGGTLDVREGAVTVDSGACRTGGAYKTAEGTSVDFGGNALGPATFAGTGTFANGTAAGGVIAAPLADDGRVGACPSFADMTLTGVRVDFGRTEPLEGEIAGLVVATFPNGAPDVSGWRSRNTGKGTRAKFRVAGNGKDVLADVAPVGIFLLVR